jgi:hypothetical protein
MHAQAPHELVLLGEHGGEFVIGGDFFGGDLLVIGQMILFGAASFTLFAAYAECGVI